jgi:hypothetical protein
MSYVSESIPCEEPRRFLFSRRAQLWNYFTFISDILPSPVFHGYAMSMRGDGLIVLGGQWQRWWLRSYLAAFLRVPMAVSQSGSFVKATVARMLCYIALALAEQSAMRS